MTSSITTPENQGAASKLHGQKMDFLRAVRFDKALTGAAITVAAILVDHYNGDEGMARPPVGLICYAANLEEKTVKRAVKALVAAGWFIVEERRVKGWQEANAYVPDWARSLSLAELSAGWKAETGKARETPARRPAARKGPAPVAPDVQDRQDAPKIETVGPAHVLPNGQRIEAGQYAAIVVRLGDHLGRFLDTINKVSAGWSDETMRQRVDRLADAWTNEEEPAF